MTSSEVLKKYPKVSALIFGCVQIVTSVGVLCTVRDFSTKTGKPIYMFTEFGASFFFLACALFTIIASRKPTQCWVMVSFVNNVVCLPFPALIAVFDYQAFNEPDHEFTMLLKQCIHPHVLQIFTFTIFLEGAICLAAIICAMIGMEWCGCLTRNRKTSDNSAVRYENDGVQVIMPNGAIPAPINLMFQPPAYETQTPPPSYCAYDPAALDHEMVARVQASNPGLNVLGWLNETTNQHGSRAPSVAGSSVPPTSGGSATEES